MYRAPNGSVRKCCSQCIARALVVRRAKMGREKDDKVPYRAPDTSILEVFDHLPVETIQEAVRKTEAYLRRRLYSEKKIEDDGALEF
ncbi:MAG: uncharacterized protein KVP18_003995 [Porospora cf. gigantea A]|uniref:uncharacterized protein n=1 Tax=Porospora cf. gigantea A TaxID=2853593 RepID=UPI003559ACA5|nr:MAG: hypothetical protein KVP18_003995 [Porospora cf. gigantea A]